MMENYQNTFGVPVNHRNCRAPIRPDDHPELDNSPLCSKIEKRQYWQCIGELQWAVVLGRIDILYATIIMARYRPAPRIGQLHRVQHIYWYLCNYKKTSIL